MELLLIPAALLVAAVVPVVLRHVRASAWDRELDEAFGVRGSRDMPRHRAL